jgi:hypothetical protein
MRDRCPPTPTPRARARKQALSPAGQVAVVLTVSPCSDDVPCKPQHKEGESKGKVIVRPVE